VLLKGGDFDGVALLAKEVQEFQTLKLKITKDGMQWLEQGLEQGNQQILSKGVQVFVNLQTLPQVVFDTMDGYLGSIQQTASHAFDLNSLNAEMNSLKQSGQVSTKTVPLVAFAGILWGRTEKLADAIYAYTSKIHTLESFLSRRSDSSPQTFLLQYVLKELAEKMHPQSTLKSYFWTRLCCTLDDEIKKCTRAATFLLQVLQAGYPKLLRIFNDLFARIRLVTGEDAFGKEFTERTLQSFEAAYVSRSITRMLETVNQIAAKGPPNREDAQKIARTMSSELNAVKFDDTLLQLICNNMVKALNIFKQKTNA
ncbi:Conserved oligomeric Golgi complex subunit, partial [Kappamyces sp. JEL0680]